MKELEQTDPDKRGYIGRLQGAAGELRYLLGLRERIERDMARFK
ncbi:MAG TPA: hypothetical protein VF161_10515 [Steroidobacteraceae bacterium]